MRFQRSRPARQHVWPVGTTLGSGRAYASLRSKESLTARRSSGASMSDITILIWSMIGTWVNAIAMAAAAVFAALAWRAQVRYAHTSEQRAKRDAAVAHAAAAIIDLTTGSVAAARRRVADWTTDFADDPPSHRRTGGEAQRGDSLAGKYANTKLRNQAFVLLWSLQRLGPLSEDVALAQSGQRDVLISHVNLMVETLSRFSALLEVDELRLFRQSADATIRSLLTLAEAMDRTMEQSLEWSVGLSGFSLEVVADDEVPEFHG